MTESTQPPSTPRLSWLTDPARREQVVSLLMGAVHPDYIAHGDIVDGRARSGDAWVTDLADVLTRELASVDLRDGPFIEPGLRVALAELDGRLVGVATVVRVAPAGGSTAPVHHAQIDDLAVAEGWRGRGIGTALVRWVEEQLRAAGVPRVSLESGIRNMAAQRLFARLGYVVTSVTATKEL